MATINCRKHRCLLLFFTVIVAALLCFSVSAATAANGSWYRLRTNHVPYYPLDLNRDSQGLLWLTATDEYACGVWRLNPVTGKVSYITNSAKNNYVGAANLDVIVKPQLQAQVADVLRTPGGDTWYTLKDQGVLCEKANGEWLSYTRANTGQLPSDDVQSLRLLTKSDGSTEVLLISFDGLALIDPTYRLTTVRNREYNYNNYMYREYNYNNYMYNDALRDTRGRFWIARNNGLETGDSLLNTSGVNSLFPGQPVPPVETPVTGIMEDDQGNLWFISDAYVSQGIYRYGSDGNWRHYDLSALVNAGVTGNQVHCQAVDNTGNLWFGLYYGGLVRYSPANGTWTKYSGESLSLLSETVIAVTADQQGIWFVTGYNPAVPGNGTGVHFLPINAQGQPQPAAIVSYDYRSSSTTLASNRINGIAADQVGGVWFAAYDRPSLARLKADGSWQQFHSGQNGVNFGEFGIVGLAADAKNNIFIVPQRQQPLAYNAAREEWVTLPVFPVPDTFYYGVYRDAEDGIWIYSAVGAFYLDPGHTGWQQFTRANSGLNDDYVDNGVLVDPQKRVWFQGRYGISLLRRTAEKDQWQSFTAGDNSGYNAGYRVYADDLGNIWNVAKQKFNPQTGKWETPADTTPFDRRTLQFLNGTVNAGFDLSMAPSPVTDLNEQLMTIDTSGRIYFAGG
ncbi:MAG: hypothetical protein PHU78_09275, partial [Heliobacteriaceae bacterium]|nr:hypothetical protein [Heliobacteriaceae bacterium]